MSRTILLNAFAMNTLTHQSPGLWRHPRDRSTEFNRLPIWLELARLWERGLFDGVFLADVLGPYDVFGVVTPAPPCAAASSFPPTIPCC